ncbi:MAG: HAD family hydrolase, partial [Dongiaceae bacterium]
MTGAPELVIFDCDGVLVDSEFISFQVEAAAFAEIGIPLTTEDLLQRFVGTSSASMFAIIEREHGRKLPVDFQARISAQVRAAFDRELKAIPGIAELLAGLVVRKCVASSSDPDRIR